MSQTKLFIDKFDEVIKPVLQVSDPRLEVIADRLKEMLTYNTRGGKLNRGVAVLDTVQYIIQQDSLPNADRLEHSAIVMGWCVEILQAFFLVADDIMDRSEMRRGQQCWYKKDNIGVMAVNDSFLIQSSIYSLLKQYFAKESWYIDVLHLFLEVSRNTEFGQAQDLLADQSPLEAFTMDRYSMIVEYKTAYYSFYLPVALALHITGRGSEEALAAAQDILLKIGHYFQVQDDYLDCYGDPSVIGKIGTDIQEKKCSWLFVTAASKCTTEQLSTLYTHYGKSDDHSVAIVKELYRTLDLQQCYLTYANSTYQEITAVIAECKVGLPKEIFQGFLDKIHKRSK